MRARIVSYKIIFWLIFFVLFWVLGCTAPNKSSPIPSRTQTLIPSATKTPQPITNTAEFSSDTLTSTPEKSTSTPSLTSSSTPTKETLTQTPAPTLPLEEAKILALKQLRNNGDCRLPCWWGIMPGETNAHEAVASLNILGNIITSSISNDEGGYFGIHIPQNNLILRSLIEYRINKNNNIVELLALQIQGVYEPDYEDAYGDPLFAELAQYYMLPQILSAYGSPSEVLVWANRFPKQLYLLINYAWEGFMINYVAPMEQVGQKLSSCPSDAYIELWLWPPERNYSPADVVSMKYGEGTGQDWFAEYFPLEDATSLTEEEFYTIFSDPNSSSCLETPLDRWPEP